MQNPTHARDDRRAVHIALGLGALYVASAWASPMLFELVGVPYPVTLDYLRAQGVRHALTSTTLQLLLFLLLVSAITRTGGEPIRYAMSSKSGHGFFGIWFFGATVFFVLDHIGVWPWIWHSPESSVVGYYDVVVANEQWFSVVLLLVKHGFLVPVLEEVIFRFGLLRLIANRTRSHWLALVVSSLIFSAAHFGPGMAVAAIATMPGIRIFLFGLIVGAITVKQNGNISTAIALHSARNTVELAAIVLWLGVR